MTLNEDTLRNARERDTLNVDVLIIGAGLFGSIIGDALERSGREVTYIDALRPEAGSRPAACLMRPSWLSSMGKERYEPALKLLDSLYGIEDITFRTKPLNKAVTVHWIPPERIMRWGQAIKGTVTEIFEREHEVVVKAHIEKNFYYIKPRLLIVAAGIWTKRLYHLPELSGLAGAAFTWQGSTYENIINVWAPYKQLVVLNSWQDDTLWVGDGSAIKSQNWTSERQQESLERCARIVNRAKDEANVIYGIRPYLKGKPFFLEKVYNNMWVATAGAKNGTVAAGWAASEILKAEA
jgi:glycine/D-amino acid oxidase-like deaminating enzyme